MRDREWQRIERADLWLLAEFSCWVVVLLAPILMRVNGPAVSADQCFVRLTVSAMTLAGGLGIRVGKVVCRRRRFACPPVGYGRILHLHLSHYGGGGRSYTRRRASPATVENCADSGGGR